jgi:hypothetical protein
MTSWFELQASYIIYQNLVTLPASSAIKTTMEFEVISETSLRESQNIKGPIPLKSALFN